MSLLGETDARFPRLGLDDLVALERQHVPDELAVPVVAEPSFGTAATSIRPPSGVNLMALERRLRTTCLIFRSSP
jgi:hypothetical protein